MSHCLAHWPTSRQRWASRFLWLLMAWIGYSSMSASASTTQQIIYMHATDGRSVPALVTYPEGGPDTAAPVAIIHHGGPGGHPLRALSASRWAADYFADRGYITISLLSRISRDVIDQPFGAGVADIKGAIDWASQLSAGPIVLVGHSSGSVSNSLYMANTQDARVKAIVHFAPTAGGSDWMIRNMGKERYDSVVARLRKLVAQGQGDQPIYEDHHLAPPAPPAVTYGYLMSARTWLSWWGPESKNRNLDYFPKIHVPMLMIAGDADIFVSREYQESLRKAAINSPLVEGIILEGGIPHEFTGAEQKAAGLAFDWLSSIGVHPQPRISTRVVDLKIGTDLRPGIIYEPTEKSLRRALTVMLLPDFADDVMVSPLDTLGPLLAKAGYSVLMPQDRGSGWPFYRVVASDVIADQQAWLKHLTDEGHGRVAVIAHGWRGILMPMLLSGSASGSLAGIALIQPPEAPQEFAKKALGAEEYARAVKQAEGAVARNEGGTTMIIAKYRADVHSPAESRWFTHMATGFLSFWGPAAPASPVPALQATGVPLLLIDAGHGPSDQVTRIIDNPEKLSADLDAWLDALPPHTHP